MNPNTPANPNFSDPDSYLTAVYLEKQQHRYLIQFLENEVSHLQHKIKSLEDSKGIPAPTNVIARIEKLQAIVSALKK